MTSTADLGSYARRRVLAATFLALTQTLVGYAQSVTYDVRFPAPQTQRVEVEATFAGAPSGPLAVHLPTWRPGRYQILDLASGLSRLEARDGDGSPLAVRKTAKSTWEVEGASSGEVRVSYSVYANELGSRTRHVDATHAFLSGSSVFVYTPSLRQAPVEVRVDLPENWKIASGLEQSGESALRAPSYDVLVDSPIELGLHDLLTYAQGGKTYEVVVWPQGVRFDRERLLADFAEITAEHVGIFGRAPFDRYVFLVHAGGGARGGTEHLNSTIMQVNRSALEGSFERTKAYKRFLGLVSHEFFHTWNVKQLRPEGIQPYDYQAENYSTLFWVAEGTTSYYGPLTLARRELTKPKEYLEALAADIDAVRRRPGSGVQSLADSSFDAWIKFNRPSPDDVNTTVSFYRRGALMSLVLDAWLRRQSEGQTTLDDVLRTLYQNHPLSSGGFSEGHLRVALQEAATADPSALFDRHVHGNDPLPLEEALETFGLELYLKPRKRGEGEEKDEAEPENDDSEELRARADLGVTLADRNDRTTLRAVLAGGPAYAAGLHPGDELIALDGRRLRASDEVARLSLYEVGETVEVTVMRHDELLRFDVVLAERADGKWALRHAKSPTARQKASYESWIGQEFPKPKGKDDA